MFESLYCYMTCGQSGLDYGQSGQGQNGQNEFQLRQEMSIIILYYYSRLFANPKTILTK